MDIYGIIGYPIKHSLSPAMHNAAFKELGIDAEYKLFEVKPEDLEDFLLNRKDVVGFNITIPHKVKAKEILFDRKVSFDRQKDLYYVEICGAINTVKRDGNELLYANTDVKGFLTSLEKDLKFDYTDKKVLVIAAGGAGRAVIAGLSCGDNSAKKIYIYEKDSNVMAKARDFFLKFLERTETINFISKDEMQEAIKDCQLLVNASPLGMQEGDVSPVDKKFLHKDLAIYDVVYNRKTQLVKDAESLRLKAKGGLGMFLYQGAASFEFWTGKKAPVEVMREALDKALTGSTGKAG